MLPLGWVHVRVLSTWEGQWGLFGGLWVCIIVNRPLKGGRLPTPYHRNAYLFFASILTASTNGVTVVQAPWCEAQDQ